MGSYFDRVKDVTIYCPYCKETFSGHVKAADNIDKIKCPKCNGIVEVKKVSKEYDVPS